MKIFLDTAQVDSIKKWSSTGLIDGVTTNPSILSKEGGNPVEQIKKIAALLPDGDISVEITEKEPQAVYEQAKKIAAIAGNIVVKVPCHPDYFEIIKKLSKEGVRLNITLVFSALQGLMMAKLGVTYISPFVGRLEDQGADGIQVIHDLRLIMDQYDFTTEILAASLRSVEHVHQVALAGADVATVSPENFEKSIQHQLTDAGMKKFDEDWQKLGITQFP